MSKRSLVVVSGDPGATTGLVAVRFISFAGDGSPRWEGAQWLGDATVHRPSETKQRRTPASRDLAFCAKLLTTIAGLTRETIGARSLYMPPQIAVLEEPADGAPMYAENKQQANRRDVAFRLGAAYGMLVSALQFSGHPPKAIYSYPVRTLRDRQGWMARSTKPQEITASRRLYAVLKSLPIRGVTPLLSEHCLMALGVLRYWVDSPDAMGSAEHAIYTQ